MTIQDLEIQREEICMKMLEAEGKQLRDLKRKLFWIEELIIELEQKNEKE